MNPEWSRRERRKLDLAMLGEHFLGGRVASLWDARRQRIEDALVSDAEPQIRPLPEHEGSLEDFLRGPLADNRPVVMRGAASEWPAIERWTPSFFAENHGDEPIRILFMGPDQLDHQAYASDDLPLRDAIERLDEGNRAYLRFVPTLMKNPSLQADLDMEWIRARQGGDQKLNLQLFVGGAGTATALHTGISSNLFVQVHGRKRWRIFAPHWTHAFKPPMRRSLYFESSYNPYHPDLERFPLTRGLQGYDVTLEAGDVLFNPPFWWHYVDNPTVSVGVGVRWMPLGRCLDASRLLTLLTVFSVDPPMLAAPLLDLDFTRMFSTRVLPRRKV